MLKDKEILIVDDDRDSRLLAKRILEGAGALVCEAETVDEGLTLASQHAFHLIITDLALPGKNGFDLLTARRASAFLASVPVIVLSGSKDRDSVTSALSMGAADYMIKPFQATRLLQKARKILRADSEKCWKFEPSEIPTVDLSVTVDLLEISEAGCKIDSPVKLADEARIQLQSELLEELAQEVPLIRTKGNAVSAGAANRYLIQLNFVGVGNEFAQRFRLKTGGAA